MFKKCQQDNVLMFPQKQKPMEIGSVNLSLLENGEVSLSSNGLSLKELRLALGFAIHLAYDVEHSVSA